jgi:hypothetical protein
MSVATETREVTANDRIVGNTILGQLGGLIRGCLDMSGKKCYIVPNGVLARKVIVNNKNNRGDILITLNGFDLYDLTVTRTRTVKGETITETLKEFSGLEGLDVVQLREVLDNIWR